MSKNLQHIILTLALFVTSLQIIAQTFPVQVIPQVTPPPPVYLSDYASTNNSADRVRAQVLLTDLTVLNREVRLKLYIEGNGINTQSRDFVIGAQPIFLDGGIPVQLGSIDLAPYFELQNLQGISAGAYANAIPEGLYQFCFEVYDVLSGNRISNKSCTNVLIFLNDPPFLNLPENNINLEANNPQNILFQWTPRHINVSNVQYEFSLVEIWDTNVDPQAIFLSSPPIYQITTQATTLLYGLAEPQLLEGKRYAWRVKAQALDGIDEIGLFKNNGYSEIFSFTYQGECNAPSYLTVEEVGTKTATFKWQGEIDHTQYKIDYRKAIDEDGNTGNLNTNHWFESTANREEFIVIDLEHNTMYEWRVGGFCADGTLSFAELSTFTTMVEEAEAYYNCGIEPTINIANQILLDELQVGDVIKAGDFNVKIQEVSGNGSFSGKGYTTVGFLKNLKIALEFTNIHVNTEYQFVNGEIKTVYDPTWSNILDIDEVIDEFEDIVDVFTGDDIVIITLDYDITVSDITVDTDTGQIIVNNPNGNPSTFDYDTGDTYTITDASGDQFEIDANGEVTQTGFGAEGGAATAANTFGITDGHSSTVGDPSVRNIERHAIGFIYKKGDNTKYELDQQNNDYEKTKYPKVTIEGGNHYYPVHKAIVEGGTEDYFIVDIANNTNYINNDSLIFKTVSGTKVPAVKNGTNSYKITVKGRNSYTNEEAIITYKDTLGKQHVLSSFFIHHIKKFPTINVKVVLVNNATNIDNLQAKLDAIYKPTGISFNVNSKVDELTIAKADWDVDVSNGQIDYNGSGLVSDHPKELRAIKDYYKNQNSGYDSKAYHLFIIDDSMPVTKALAGFMPKKNQWGFLFEAHYSTNIQNKGTVSTIAAHELGHGVFALGHPFGEDENNSGTANTWLMDYTNGTELAYPNWAKMSDDSLQLHLFQNDQDNEFGITVHLIGYNVLPGNFSQYVSTNLQIYSFVSSVGKIISIPSSATDITFKGNGALHAFNILENGKNERYIGSKKGGKFKGYLKSLNKDIPWNQRVFKDNFSKTLPNNVVVYTGKLNKTSEDCGIDLFKGSFKNEADKNDWNSGGEGIIISNTFDAYSTISNITNINPNNQLINSPEACDFCDEGEKFFDDYKNTASNESEKDYLLMVSKMICEEGTDELIAAQRVQYEKWKESLNTIPEILNQKPFSFESYYNSLLHLKKWVEHDVSKILTNENRDLLFKIAYALEVETLSLLNIEYKLKLLQILLSDKLYNIFTINQDQVVVKVVKSIKDVEAVDFINGLSSEKYNDKKNNPLIYNLKNRLSDFLNNVNSYSEFFFELKRISDAKNRNTKGELNIKTHINWDVEQKDYVLLSFVKVNNDYLYTYNKSNHTNNIETCKKYSYNYNDIAMTSEKTCIEDEFLLPEGSSPFDLVTITFINDISPFGSKYISNTESDIEGEAVVLPAIFLDYLNFNLSQQQLSNLGWNTFNVVLTMATLGEGGAAIVAIRGAQAGTKALVIAKHAWVLADFAYTVTDLGLEASGVERPEIWKDVGYVFAAKGASDIIKNGVKGLAGLKNTSKNTRRKIVDELGVKKHGKPLTDSEIDEFITKAETKIKNNDNLKDDYQTALNEVISKNTFTNNKYSNLEAAIPQKTSQANLSKGLFKNKALKITPTESVLQSKIDNILSNGDSGGNITEDISDILYQTDGFVKKEVKLGSNQGIDGLYVKGDIENPIAIRIDEAKYSVNFDTNGIKLNSANTNTGLPVQMSDDWIQNVANRMKIKGQNENNNELIKLADMLIDHQNIIQKSVTAVNPKTGEINILKLDNYLWEK